MFRSTATVTDDVTRLDACDKLAAVDEVPLNPITVHDAAATSSDTPSGVEQTHGPKNVSISPTFGYKPLNAKDLPKKLPYYRVYSTPDSDKQVPTVDEDKHHPWLTDMESSKCRTFPRRIKASTLPVYGTVIRRGSQKVILSAVGSNTMLNRDFQGEDDPNIIDLTSDSFVQGEGGRTDQTLRERFQDKAQPSIPRRIVRKGSTKITTQVQARSLSPESNASCKYGNKLLPQETSGGEEPKPRADHVC